MREEGVEQGRAEWGWEKENGGGRAGRVG